MPFINSPYISEISFLKDIHNHEDKVKKTYFKDHKILSPFFFYLELKSVENNQILYVRFYNEKSEKCTELSFDFGEDGKFYEYIIFTDKVTNLHPGKYRYTIFINKTLIYEDNINIEKNNTVLDKK